MQLLLIKLPAPEGNPEYALLGKKQEEDRFTPGDWKKIRSLTRGRRVVLLVPDNEVVLTSVTLPSKNKKQLAQAIPYALEENLADDIENLHFTIHKNKQSDESHVAIINRSRLTHYLNDLNALGIAVHFVLPQLFTLDYHKNSWTLQVSDSNAQVRLDKLSGFSCNSNMLELLLPEQLEKSSPDEIYTNLPTQLIPDAIRDIPIKTSHDVGQVKRNSIEIALPLNLLPGFVRERKTPRINLKQWKPVFILSALLVAVWLGIIFWQNQLLSRQRSNLDAAIARIYKNTFPNGRIVDPPQQMASKLKQLQSNKNQSIKSPLPLIAGISPILKKHQDINLREIRYQDNELRLVVRASSLTRLDAFKKDAQNLAKINVDIKSSTTTANQVEATLVITPLDTNTAKKQQPKRRRDT